MTLVQRFAEADSHAYQQRRKGFGSADGRGQLEDQDLHSLYFLKTVASLSGES